jgi:GntR family transcriptional regulator
MPRHHAGIIRSVQAAYALRMPLVDHDSPVPLYAQLAAELRRRIAEEGLVRLPSYVSLMQEHGVSRETADRAVHVLIDAGEAYVVPGKGTYAGTPPR